MSVVVMIKIATPNVACLITDNTEKHSGIDSSPTSTDVNDVVVLISISVVMLNDDGTHDQRQGERHHDRMMI